MFGAFHSNKLSERAREKLIATRVEIIGELPEAQRCTIMASRLAAFKIAPNLDQADRAVQERVLSKIAPPAGEAFAHSWDHVTNHTS